MKLLIVEDDHRALGYLQKGLQESGCTVDTADNGIDGLHLARTEDYDVIVLDGMLPGLDGVDLVQALRVTHRTPVIMLTARDGVADRVRGLQAGADDYLVKPFSFVELLARLHALVRRSAPLDSGKLSVADLVLDPMAQHVTRAGKRIHLTAKEFQLLATLMRRKGQVLSKTALAELVWGIHFDCDLNVVEAAIKRLRSKIDEDDTNKLLHTVRGMGYVLELREGSPA